jgi:hypothetical protein
MCYPFLLVPLFLEKVFGDLGSFKSGAVCVDSDIRDDLFFL